MKSTFPAFEKFTSRLSGYTTRCIGTDGLCARSCYISSGVDTHCNKQIERETFGFEYLDLVCICLFIAVCKMHISHHVIIDIFSM